MLCFQTIERIKILKSILVALFAPENEHIVWTDKSPCQGWRQKFSDRGAGASDRGAKMTEKWCFRALFCQISSDEDQKISSDGGARCPRQGGCSPLALPWRHPCPLPHVLVTVSCRLEIKVHKTLCLMKICLKLSARKLIRLSVHYNFEVSQIKIRTFHLKITKFDNKYAIQLNFTNVTK